jgi:1-pyrroline-5-carboxylate dehydrogenase
MLTEFQNEPLVDFSQTAASQSMDVALATVEGRLGRSYPLIVGAGRVTTGETIRSLDPSQKDQVVGVVAHAGRAQAEQAVDAAYQAFETWRWEGMEERARYLLRAAGIMRRRKFELEAWEVFEAGKPWPEADADVAEAIDFLEYYAREAIGLAHPQRLTPLAGEQNELSYLPLGVGLVATPFNFPLAILTGMASAAIVTGNTIVVKPSDRTPVIAVLFAEIMEEAGLPPGVLNILPGPNAEVGDYLVGHPRTRFMSFTGSRAVGLHIVELAARAREGQHWIKRVIAEMGGKDAIIVHDDADLEAAAAGIVVSAFGFQGQKCSACSRAILLDAIHDEVVERVVAGARALPIGPARDPHTLVGPLIDQRSYDTVLSYIEVGRIEGQLLTGGHPVPGLSERGYFVEPTVFADVEPGARIAQEEIFGPVLTVLRARDLNHALAIANGTPYGLTGAIYARDRAVLERARREFHVGNLYLNRKCTGALVGAQPFGGFDMSGTDAKAGGPDYLLQLTQPKVTSERF